MALSQTQPLVADTGGRRRDPYRSASFYATAATVDNTSYQSSSRKHRIHSSIDADAGIPPPLKRRKPVFGHDDGRGYQYHHAAASDAPSTSAAPLPPPISHANSPDRRQPDETRSEEDPAFMSRDEIERCSPSRKDGIGSLLERQLRYSYCAYLQSLGFRLQLPNTTVGTAMVLCHRFFIRRSHATHDRFLIATAALFLASKSEETPCLLNTVLRTSCEICQEHNFGFHPYSLYSQDWFEQYRERVIEAEQMILMALDFELEVQHPYIPLTSVLNKLGLSQTVLLNLAWNLVNEGVFTRIICRNM